MNLAIIELSFWLRLIIKKNRVFCIIQRCVFYSFYHLLTYVLETIIMVNCTY